MALTASLLGACSEDGSSDAPPLTPPLPIATPLDGSLFEAGALDGSLFYQPDAALDDDASLPSDAGLDASRPKDASTDAASDAQAKDANVPDAATSTESVNVTVAGGALKGKTVGDTREFLGIYYARPPVGNRRFAPPVAEGSWTGTKDVVEFGSRCPQPGSSTVVDEKEDCLTLNVYAPVRIPTANKLPVMVYLQGDAFLSGDVSDESTVDPARLSEMGQVVVVTLNYRLGALGFLAHGSLDTSEVPSGNNGLRDQQMALKWVKDNIAVFGGDADKVTLFGNSAGAVSVCLHMFAEGSADLAQRFIVQSGACVYGPLAPRSRAAATKAGDDLVKAHCNSATDKAVCLRGLSADTLANYKAPDSDAIVKGFWPHIDGKLIKAHPYTQLDTFSAAPVIAGSTLHEWTAFQTTAQQVDTRAELDAFIDKTFGSMAAAVKSHYSADSREDENDTLLRLMTDAYFRCPARALVRAVTEREKSGYLYSWEHTLNEHGDELPFLFDPAPREFLGVPLRAANLVNGLQGYWTNFAKSADPNGNDVKGKALTTWKKDDDRDHPHQLLKDPFAQGRDLATTDCDFWDVQYKPPTPVDAGIPDASAPDATAPDAGDASS